MWVQKSCLKFGHFSYLDRGFDLPSDPDASFPLLPEEKNDDEDFSLPNDGLGTRFLPVGTTITYQQLPPNSPKSTYPCWLRSHKPMIFFSTAQRRSFRLDSRVELFSIKLATF
jgi:hypothetical protein